MIPSLPPQALHAATVIAHRKIVVSCIGNLGDAGETVSEFVMLDNSVCRDLLRFIRGSSDGAAVGAVLVLAHEAEHARGITDETDAECAAYRDVGRVIRLLHRKVTPDLRRTLVLAHGLDQATPAYTAHPCR